MAAYGCLHEWPGLLDTKEGRRHPQGDSNEEKAATKASRTLARAAASNKKALHGTDKNCSEMAADKAESLREDRASVLVVTNHAFAIVTRRLQGRIRP